MSGFSPSIIQPVLKSYTRDVSLATGNVGYTGVGFKPTRLIFVGALAAGFDSITFLGMTDVLLAGAISYSQNTTQFNISNAACLAFINSTNSQIATLVSYDADGFTLSWTKGGTPTGTASFSVLCSR